MVHTVAIVRFLEIENTTYYDGDYDTSREFIASNISDWEEVDDEQFNLLCKVAQASKKYQWDTKFEVIEKLKTTSVDIVNSVEQYVAMVAKKESQAAESKAAREAATEKKRRAKLMKDKESRKALLKELQAEFGEATK